MHLMVQPNIAQMMLSNNLLIEQGLLSRCLCVYPKSTVGTRRYKAVDLTEPQAMRTYRDKISEILHTPYNTGNAKNELQPNRVELDGEAKRIWQMFHDKVEDQLSKYGILSSIKGLGNKAPEHALRLATVLAGFDAPEISNFSKISNLPDLKIKNSHLSVENATELFKERGWIQIYSTYLESNIYLVRDDAIRVPDPSIPKYTQAEIQSLKDLTLDELKTLHEAKVLFKGKIIS